MDSPKRRLERLACDRCHRQKLRCNRVNDSRACQRCVKAGESCVYSPPLRLGRPAGGAKSAAAAAAPGRARRPESARGRRDGPSPLTPPTPPTITEAPHSSPYDVLESLAKASRPPTPPACLGLQSSDQRPLGTAALTPLSDSPVFAAMGEPLGDYLFTPASTTTGLDETFILPDLEPHYGHDGSMLLDMCDGADYLVTPAPTTTDDFSLYAMDPCAAIMDDGQARRGDDDGPERRLLELQRTLLETPCAAGSVSGVDGLQRTIDVTAGASNMLLSIMMALTEASSSSSSAESGGGAATTTMLLVTGCYARILRNVSAIAARLQAMVCSGDPAAPLLPCVHIGSLATATAVAPAVQTSMLVQLLSQSLREVEKRMPALARALLLAPAMQQGQQQQKTLPSHIADVVGAINGELAALEAHVKGALGVTLDLLAHGDGLGVYYAME